jgi:hypothetical protein
MSWGHTSDDEKLPFTRRYELAIQDCLNLMALKTNFTLRGVFLLRSCDSLNRLQFDIQQPNTNSANLYLVFGRLGHKNDDRD